MLDDRDFFELLDKVLQSGLRALERWRQFDGGPACIAGEVEDFLRLHDQRRHRDETPEETLFYFRRAQ